MAVATRSRSGERGLGSRATRLDASPLRHVDWMLLSIPVAISAFGMLMIYSSTRTELARVHASTLYYVERQGIAIAIGIVGMLVVMAIDYRRIRDVAALIYLALLPVLVGVLVVGASRSGAQSWFQVGPLQFQPSEIAKVVLVVALGAYCHHHRGDLDAWRVAVAVGIALVPIGLVLLQNDLGTAMVLAVVMVAMLLVAGVRSRYLAVLLLLALTALGAAVSSGYFQGYKLDRLTSFLDQKTVAGRSATPAEYNLEQAKAAIGSGRLTGKGLFEGTQTKLGYVPEQHTDFIFTVVGEELGFVGGATLLALYGLLLWRMWRTSLLSSDAFGSFVSIGVMALLAFHVFENVGMTMGIMPITGIPLPFMSYGGSAVIATFLAVGLVANVHMRRFS